MLLLASDLESSGCGLDFAGGMMERGAIDCKDVTILQQFMIVKEWEYLPIWNTVSQCSALSSCGCDVKG